MIIANPLYDTAFKGLANDPIVVKAIVEALLETEVFEITMGATERNLPLAEDDKRPRFFRMDYYAVIRTKTGAQKILIEMQKASGSEDLLRFREYLAVAGYMPDKNTSDPVIPIVTIYFLGFKLKNVTAPCLKVARQYIDMLKNEVIDTKEKFVELLTHDSFVIQAPRIKVEGTPQTKLERILSIFQQDSFADTREETINYKFPIEEPYHQKMVDILHYIGTDPDERKKLDDETYWERFHYHSSGKLAEALEALDEQREKVKKREEEVKKQKEENEKQREEIESLKKQIEAMVKG
jgi:hypothetical protein